MSCESEMLLKSLRDGRPDAFKQLYDQYYDLLFTKALRMVKDPAIAQDRVQEVFIQFWQKKLYNEVHTSLSSYLFVITHTNCLAYLKLAKRAEEKKQVYYRTVANDVQSDCYNPVQLIENEKEKAFSIEMMLSNFNALPPAQQKALRLVYMEEMSYKQAAIEMGTTYHTIRNNLAKAFKKFRLKKL